MPPAKVASTEAVPVVGQLKSICTSIVERSNLGLRIGDAGRRQRENFWAAKDYIRVISFNESARVNKLYYGDNLTVLRGSIDDESVDLIYLDPPFNSQATYNVLFRSTSGEQSHAQIEAFEDTWHWGDEAELAFDDVMMSNNTDAAEMLRAMRSFLKENDMMAYISMMAIRLLELRRVLKPAGGIYLHCDPTASHYLKIVMDSIFGPNRFLNEVIWKRTSGHNSARRWGPVHDVLHFYANSEKHVWNRTAQSYDEKYVKDFYRFEDPGGRYRLGDLTGAGTRSGDSGAPWRDVDPTRVGRHWAVPNKALIGLGFSGLREMTSQEKLDLLDSSNLICWPPTGNMPQFKRYFKESSGVPIQDVISDIRPLSAQETTRVSKRKSRRHFWRESSRQAQMRATSFSIRSAAAVRRFTLLKNSGVSGSE